MKTINTLIVDDHPMVRDGLRMMLEVQNDPYSFSVDEAETGDEAIGKVRETDYDFVIMDYQLPDKKGDAITKEILEISPEVKVLGLSNYDEYVYAAQMLEAGARGYVLKNIDAKELVQAIEKIMANQMYYSADIANKLINHTLGGSKKGSDKSPKDLADQLSKREKEIIQLIVEQLTNEEISRRLDLSKRTIDNHRQNILSKLQLRNTAGLVRFAVENNLVS